MMGRTVGKPKRGPWQGRKLCRPDAFEFFDYTGTGALRQRGGAGLYIADHIPTVCPSHDSA